MSSLFDLEAELNRIRILAESNDDGEIPAELVEWIEKTEVDFDFKVEAWASVIGELKALTEARDKEMLRLRALRDQTQKSVDRMVDTLRQVMTRTGRTRVETTRYKVWVQNAGGKEALVIPDKSLVPDRFIETKTLREVNGDAIRSALEAGECLEFASLSPRGNVLRIK